MKIKKPYLSWALPSIIRSYFSPLGSMAAEQRGGRHELDNARDHVELQKAYFTQLFENSPEGIVLLERSGAIREANAAFQRMFGYARDELIGRTPLSLIVPEAAVDTSLEAFRRNVEHNEPARLSAIRRRKNGELISVDVLAYPVLVNGEPQGVFAIYQDVTEKEQALREIEYQVRHDRLTGLTNGPAQVEVMHRLLDECDDKTHHAFLYLNIDQFKVINDSCGHSEGDRALVEIAELLQSCVRGTDLVARYVSDEFGVLLYDCDPSNAQKKAEEIVEAICSYKFVSDGYAYTVGVSIGLVELDDGTPSVEYALNAADAACYAAKDAGRNRVCVYQSDHETITSRRNDILWASKLRTAVEEDGFVLFFQEIQSLSDPTQSARFREILIRYKDDDGTLVPPGAFIPAAEQYNVMPAIDRWVVKTTCEYLARHKGRLLPNDVVFINLSGTTLSDERFAEFVKETLATTGINGFHICFEITETAAIENLDAAKRLIGELKILGCTIALDDFGSGMSSFRYLRTLSIDYLKIDGAFVRDMHTDQVDCAMTEAINHIGKIMGIKTVAEFVENQEIYEKLKLIGVDYAQGYGLHVPEQWTVE